MITQSMIDNRKIRFIKRPLKLNDSLQCAGVGVVIPRQTAEGMAEGGGADDVDERPQPVVGFPVARQAEVVRFPAHAQEVEPGLVADEAEANAGIGPALADSLGDAAMVGRETSRRSAFAQFVEAFPRSRAGLATDPAQLRPHDR